MLSSRILQQSYGRSIPSRWTSLGSDSCRMLSSPERRDDQKRRQQQPYQIRNFHATNRQEILPVIAVGLVLFVGRYSWKALNRMDEEWEDYQWQLEQYERQRMKEQAADVPTTIGVDLGTFYLKLSAMNASNKPELVPTAQGDRYRFTGILFGKEDDDPTIVGRTALEKFYYSPENSGDGNDDLASIKGGQVVLPYRELQKASHEEAAKLVQQVMLPTVGEALDRVATNVEKSSSKEVRTVLTLPPMYFNQHGQTIFQNYHDESHHTITVPDPVAAIWGAQESGLLPTPETKEEKKKSVLVVDVGGLATSVSLVKQDVVTASCTLDNVGGESYVQQLIHRILKESGDETMGKDPMSLALIHTGARLSVLELVQKTQAKVHIPYLFMGRKPDQPHLDTTISRVALEQAVQDYWVQKVVPGLMEGGVLASSLPPPTNAASLITSAVTKVLEESEETPMNIEHILLVGGGSKHKMMEQAVQDGIWALMGPSPQKLVIPEATMRADLTALGAASLLPNFDYSYDGGLVRAEK